MRSTRSVLAATMLLLSGCDDGDDPSAGSSFGGELTGAYSETLDGEAHFGVVRTGGSTGFTILLGEGGSAVVALQTPGTERPAAGTYEIVAPDFPEPDGKFHGTVAYTLGSGVEQFELRGGTLTLTSSDGDTIDGSVELRAERTSPCCDPAPVQIFITGNFTAKPVG